MSVVIRPARPDDAALIISLISALAEYEKLSHEAKATEADILRDLFGEAPKVFCEIAEWQGKPVGFALWFYNYSTFECRPGLYLEDLFLRPAFRGHGYGEALLRHLARVHCIPNQVVEMTDTFQRDQEIRLGASSLLELTGLLDNAGHELTRG